MLFHCISIELQTHIKIQKCVYGYSSIFIWPHICVNLVSDFRAFFEKLKKCNPRVGGNRGPPPLTKSRPLANHKREPVPPVMHPRCRYQSVLYLSPWLNNSNNSQYHAVGDCIYFFLYYRNSIKYSTA